MCGFVQAHIARQTAPESVEMPPLLGSVNCLPGLSKGCLALLIPPFVTFSLTLAYAHPRCQLLSSPLWSLNIFLWTGLPMCSLTVGVSQFLPVPQLLTGSLLSLQTLSLGTQPLLTT